MKILIANFFKFSSAIVNILFLETRMDNVDYVAPTFQNFLKFRHFLRS